MGNNLSPALLVVDSPKELSSSFNTNGEAIGNAYLVRYSASQLKADPNAPQKGGEGDPKAYHHYALCLDLAGDSVTGNISYVHTQ